jgi:ectoine hydroxylase-related dioxygenase (phytanoyl-CoA dioxygenase family)
MSDEMICICLPKAAFLRGDEGGKHLSIFCRQFQLTEKEHPQRIVGLTPCTFPTPFQNSPQIAITMSFDLNTTYPLSDAQIEAYARDGHIHIPHLATPEEIAFYRAEIRTLVTRLNTERRAIEDRDTYGKAFLQIFNLWRESEILKQFVLAKRFGQVAAQLMGVERVRVYHDQALFKEAGGGHTPWHQDQFYWPLDTDNTITMWMPLVNLTSDMGIMQFVSESHQKGHILSTEISDASEAFFAGYIRNGEFTVHRRESAHAGDATFHSGWTLHNAPPNQTDVMREVMTVIYFAEGTKILEPDNTFRQNDLDTWLGGRQPGELADSEMNPLV